MVAKIDDEVYVSSTIKMFSYYSFVFSTFSKKIQLLKISKVMWLLRKFLPPCKNGRDEDNKFFGQSLLHPEQLTKLLEQLTVVLLASF